MDFFDFINANPALLSVIAFPLGLILTLAVAQKYIFTGVSNRIETWFNAYLDGYKKHTEAEVRIEERLRQLVEKLEQMLAHNWDMRRFFDTRIDQVADKIDAMDDKLDDMMGVMPKRRHDAVEEKP